MRNASKVALVLPLLHVVSASVAQAAEIDSCIDPGMYPDLAVLDGAPDEASRADLQDVVTDQQADASCACVCAEWCAAACEDPLIG